MFKNLIHEVYSLKHRLYRDPILVMWSNDLNACIIVGVCIARDLWLCTVFMAITQIHRDPCALQSAVAGSDLAEVSAAMVVNGTWVNQQSGEIYV